MRVDSFLFGFIFSFLILPAVPAMGTQAGEVQVLDRDARGVPTLVTGSLGSLGADLEEGAAGRRFLESFAARELGATGTESFVLLSRRQDELGQVHQRFVQRIRGLPVAGAELIVHSRAAGGEVIAVNGRFAADPGLPAEAEMEAKEALELAYADGGFADPELLSAPELTYVLLPATGEARLAWSALVRYEGADGEELDRVFADALVGGLVARHPQLFPVLDRQTYSANNGTGLPGTLRMTETMNSSDPVVQAAHANAGSTYDYYASRHGRDSIDDGGMTIVSTVHYGNNYNNAFWSNARQQLVYGDGNGATFSPLGGALDVVAHEFTHGVTAFESGLIYQNESGAINESLSDIFGAATEAFVDGMNGNVWKLGEDVYTPGTGGDALRYMNDPVRDGSSRDFYPNRYTGSADNGGVHWNSGIPNLAFYLLSQGGYHPRGRTPRYASGVGIATAERIFYRAQVMYLTPSSNLVGLRNLTVQAARDLFGNGSTEARRTSQAWCNVGIGNSDCLTELAASGTTFASRRWGSLSWKYADGSQVDVFRDGVKVATTANDGGHVDSFPWFGTPDTANYWVCNAGSTSSYDSSTCSNVKTVSFGFGGGGGF